MELTENATFQHCWILQVCLNVGPVSRVRGVANAGLSDEAD
jgi:hypothetical protein